jgi:TPR repeat protein
MTALGAGYLDGTLPGGDRERGLRSLERSAARGDDNARTKLGNTYLFGEHGLPVQLEKGEELLKTAADNGHAGAMAGLGRAYLDGTLGERRPAEGARMLYHAARSGHPTARYVLAEAYLESQGLEGANRDYAQAWLDTVVAGDTDAAVATLTEMLREASIEHPDPRGRRLVPDEAIRQ